MTSTPGTGAGSKQDGRDDEDADAAEQPPPQYRPAGLRPGERAVARPAVQARPGRSGSAATRAGPGTLRHPGKASLYRRWPSRAELVVAALRHAAPDQFEPPDTGDLREDLLAVLRWAADQLTGPRGEAVRGLLVEALSDPERTVAVRTRMAESRGRPILAVLHRAAERGEARPEALAPRVAGVAPALLAQHFLTRGAPIPDRVLPLVSPR